MTAITSNVVPMMILERYRRKCEFCGGWLDIRGDDNYQFTSGWTETGGYCVALPERLNKWAHGKCVDDATAV
jgi:hypothetical protein